MSAGLKSLSSRSRRLFLTFGLVTLLPTVGLFWLGTTLLGQDRELAEKQLRDHLEREADRCRRGPALVAVGRRQLGVPLCALRVRLVDVAVFIQASGKARRPH